MKVLVEGFAGMAAVTWAAMGRKPPTSYQGGKRGYAGQIIRELGVWWPDKVILVELNPFVADALRVCFDPAAVERALEVIAPWNAEDEAAQRVRWERYLNEWPDDPVLRGIQWLWMRPRTAPFQLPEECTKGNWMKRSDTRSAPRDTPRRGLLEVCGIPATVDVEIRTGSIVDLDPIPGATLYMDPPYVDTTGYQKKQRKEGPPDVEAIAQRWRAEGCLVGISEARRVPNADAYVELTNSGMPRQWGNTEEYLSIYRPHVNEGKPKPPPKPTLGAPPI